MSYQRQLRKKGEQITLGGVIYTIDCLEGLGGSSIVYKASYTDGLNTEHSHQVYIKELFPWHPKGSVYRKADGSIAGKEDGAELIEFSKKRFRQGNQINLELLKEMPSQVSGNINSFEAYGTYYSVLSLHGGETLDSLLERRGDNISLREIAVIMNGIITALECFHKKHLLHLDISPDNIMIMENQVLLIDYNSVWNICEGSSENMQSFSFSEKEGYTAPEISLRDFSHIGYFTDIYSLCAVMFKMITGSSLTENDIYGNGIIKRFSEGIPLLEGEPKSAGIKTFQIIIKGLHVVSRKRYQNLSELREDIDELIDRIDKRGISKAALWESSSSMLKKQNLPKPFLPRQLILEGNRLIDLEELKNELENRGKILLKGAAGMGKTCVLQKLWSENAQKYHPKLPVYCYVSLREHQDSEDENCHIRKSLLKNLSLNKKKDIYGEALLELEKLMEDSKEEGESKRDSRKKANIVLLLDGLSDAGEHKESLIREIEELGKKSSVGIIVTDRTNDVTEYGFSAFEVAELLPLEEETVKQELISKGIELTENTKLWGLLRNPMMLALYKDILCSEDGNKVYASDIKSIKGVNDLVGIYLQKMCLSQLRIESGNRSLQLCHKYIFNHLLPQIAKEMSRKKRSSLSFEEMYEVVQKNYRTLKGQPFGQAFPEYLGKTRLMLSEIRTYDEWFDFAVNEQLAGKLGLVEKNSVNSYSLVHDSFLRYLTSVYDKNRKTYMSKRWKYIGTRLAAGAAVIALASVVAVSAFIKNSGQPAEVSNTEGSDSYSDDEELTIKRAIATLQFNLGVLSNQILQQRNVLADALTSDILNGDEKSVETFLEYVENRRAAAEAMPISTLKPEVLDQLIVINPEIDINCLSELCEKPVDMELIMNDSLDQLKYIMSDPKSPYTTAEEKTNIIEAYKEYLNAYTKYTFYQLDYLLLNMDKEDGYAVLTGNQYSEIFRDYFTTIQIGQQDIEEVKIAMGFALQELNEATANMRTYGFDI